MAEPQGRAPALRVMKDTEVRAARLPARALPLRTRAKMEPMEASIASTAAPWAELLDLDRARARHVTQDTKARAARPPVRAQPPQSRQRTGATAPSTASTAAPSAAPQDRARAQDATRATSGSSCQAARARVLPRQLRARTGATALSTASTAAPSAAPQDRARAQDATRDTGARAARPLEHAQPRQLRARMGPTESSTASTAAPSAAPPDRARAQGATRDTAVRAVRLPGACSASSNSTKDGADGTFYCINGGTIGGTVGSCTCTSCDAGYEGVSCQTVITPSANTTLPPPPSSPPHQGPRSR